MLTSYHEYTLLMDTVHSHPKVICTKIVGSFILFEYVNSNICRVNPRVEVLLLKLPVLFAVLVLLLKLPVLFTVLSVPYFQ